MQLASATGLGALAALAAAQLVPCAVTDSGAVGLSALAGHAPPIAGAAMAATLFYWLTLRAEARLPPRRWRGLAELQSRIRPHFLFNTLNTALALVRLDPGRAESVLEDLAELFRVAITDSADAVTLGEEVVLAQRYLDIEQLRFGERLHVHWELAPEAASARVPPLILQPLVENAVRHGVEPSPEGGVIRIRTKVKLGRAVVSIANSVPKEPSRQGQGWRSATSGAPAPRPKSRSSSNRASGDVTDPERRHALARPQQKKQRARKNMNPGMANIATVADPRGCPRASRVASTTRSWRGGACATWFRMRRAPALSSARGDASRPSYGEQERCDLVLLDVNPTRERDPARRRVGCSDDAVRRLRTATPSMPKAFVSRRSTID